MNTTTSRRSRSGRGLRRRRTFSSFKPQRDRFASGRPRGRGYNSRAQSKGRSRTPRKMPSFDPSRFINTNPTQSTPEVYSPKHTFATFGLDPRILRNTTAQSLTSPTPIQDQIIPEILSGRDVVGVAETGTGKTAAFLVPLIHKTLSKYDKQTLILAPTRELALQIEAELRTLTNHMKIYATVCVGGVAIGPQIRALKRHNHFIIGTPGRILDLIKRKHFSPQQVSTVVLDEADRMLDMGFINDMRSILGATQKSRETLLFSATMNENANGLVKDFLRDPVTVSVKKRDVISSIEQDVVPHTGHNKFDTLLGLLKDPSLQRIIIFGAMKHGVEKLAKELTGRGVVAESIHGNKNQNQRQRALAKFKSGNARVLVATDVAARGIHVDNVSHVINYDLPNTFDDYVHRIGRTGRASKRGKALTFVPIAS